jgi:type I restriction enzyme M protein
MWPARVEQVAGLPEILSESVDVVYLDPPFNPNRAYNVVFDRDQGDSGSLAQIQTLDDTWHWTHVTEERYQRYLCGGLPSQAADARSVAAPARSGPVRHRITSADGRSCAAGLGTAPRADLKRLVRSHGWNSPDQMPSLGPRLGNHELVAMTSGASVTPITKEAQRAELHRTIWRIANDLRGSVDGWDFKSYVLGMLFYRFISENLAAYLNEQERKAGNPDFDYAQLSHKEAEYGRAETVAEKGFFILPSDLFVNVRSKAKDGPNLNETLERVFRNIEASAIGADSEDDLKGLFDDLDVNSPKLGNTVARRNEKLVKLLDAIGDLNLGDFNDHAIDSFGDAYEYLMTMYASAAGKSGGEFFTPQEVSELLARIAVVGKKSVNKVYDPACGSGSLLLKFAKVLGKDKVRKGFFGQEVNLTTYNLARINMFLHDINYEMFDVAHGDSLIDPAHWDDEPFEAIVSNPPYSIRWAGDSNPLLINDPRYAPAGVLAPKGKADLAFTMHMLSWLAVNGTAAIVEFPGVLYRGGAEQKIRKYLIDNNYVDAVIQLPPDLFFGTTIGTCIVVLKKSKKDNAVLFIDASAEFAHVSSKNKLMPAHQQKIIDAFSAREDADHFARVVQNTDLAANGYNISVSSYIEAKDTREAVDITKLNAEIAEIVARQAKLREQIDAIVADLENPS